MLFLNQIHEHSTTVGKSVVTNEATAVWFTKQEIHADGDTESPGASEVPVSPARTPVSGGEASVLRRRRQLPSAAALLTGEAAATTPQPQQSQTLHLSESSLSASGQAASSDFVSASGDLRATDRDSSRASVDDDATTPTDSISTQHSAQQVIGDREDDDGNRSVTSNGSSVSPAQSTKGRLSSLKASCVKWLQEANQPYLPLFGLTAAAAEAETPELSTEVVRALSVRTHWLVFLLVVVNALVWPSLISVLPPVAIFLWAGPSRPVPSFRFWTVLYVYSLGTLMLKYIFQFHFWGEFNAPPDVNDPCHDSYFRPDCLTFARFVGVYRYDDGPHFMSHLVPNALVVAALSLHRLVLEVLGLWR